MKRDPAAAPNEASMKPQLSVRDLCFVVLAAALACGWWTEHRRAEAAEKLAEARRTESLQSQGHLKLYQGLYAAVEKSGFHIMWNLHGVPQGLIPASKLAEQPAPPADETDSLTIEEEDGL
jgi:hypothetical protein